MTTGSAPALDAAQLGGGGAGHRLRSTLRAATRVSVPTAKGALEAACTTIGGDRQGARGAGGRSRWRSARRTKEKIEAASRRDRQPRAAYVHDTLDLDAAPALVEASSATSGPIDILVTNTGGPPGGDPLEFTREQWEAAHRELVVAPIEMIELVVPGMRERGFGRVVSVSSSAAREPIPSLLLSNAHRPGLARRLQDARPEARRRRHHAQHDPAGPDRDGPDQPSPRLDREGPGGGARTDPGRPARHRGGDRRGGGVPVLGARRLHHRAWRCSWTAG